MKESRVHALLREPLLHFLAIGGALFLLFGQISDAPVERSHRITITQADLDTLAAAWLRRMGRPPSAKEREQQLEHYVREQVLYREAMAMGLDQDDVIVRRRLAQKMEYLFDDLSLISEPTEAELAAFLSEYPARFVQPATISFSQIYLDPGERDGEINKDARQLLEQVTTTEADPINLGDRTLLPFKFAHERRSEIAGMFGDTFAGQAFALPPGSWQGPVTSEYGVHLILVSSRTEERLPPLAEIHDRVATAWRRAKQQAANEIFYQSLHQRYEIVLDVDIRQDVLARAKQ